jgi:hypothetical protein
VASEKLDEPAVRLLPDQYGPAFQQHLLEQYKLYVESADRVSERRTSANNYLLSVNAFLVTLHGFLAGKGPAGGWRFAVPVAGVLVCLAWWVLIRSYRDLNTAKFKVVHEVEKHLPAALFDREWQIAEPGKTAAYRPLTHIEGWIPVLFAALYLALFVFGLL